MLRVGCTVVNLADMAAASVELQLHLEKQIVRKQVYFKWKHEVGECELAKQRVGGINTPGTEFKMYEAGKNLATLKKKKKSISGAW